MTNAVILVPARVIWCKKIFYVNRVLIPNSANKIENYFLIFIFVSRNLEFSIIMLLLIPAVIDVRFAKFFSLPWLPRTRQ